MFHVITPDPSKPFTIGRKESCDLRFGDLFVSREHAVIEKRASGWFLKSLTQNSVTKVNDADVTETALKDGDIIVIGVRMLRAAGRPSMFPERGRPRRRLRATRRKSRASRR